jgi:hypothetical protein
MHSLRICFPSSTPPSSPTVAVRCKPPPPPSLPPSSPAMLKRAAKNDNRDGGGGAWSTATVICHHHHYLFHSLSGVAFGGALPWPKTMAMMNAHVPVHHNNRAAAFARGLCRQTMPSIELPSLTSLRGRQTMTTLVTRPPSSRSLMEGNPPPRGKDTNVVDGLSRRPPAAWRLALNVGPFDRSVHLAEELDAGRGAGKAIRHAADGGSGNQGRPMGGQPRSQSHWLPQRLSLLRRRLTPTGTPAWRRGRGLRRGGRRCQQRCQPLQQRQRRSHGQSQDGKGAHPIPRGGGEGQGGER